jgi:lipopolysaccharide biosynthesis glycosyltransferase
MNYDIYVGWDSREVIAYDVCEYSLKKHASVPLDIMPLKQTELRKRGIYAREPDHDASTEFSLTRFLVPALMDFSGWALFCDCDFLWLADVAELFQQADPRYACQVVKHDYVPSETVKMTGQVQHQYPRKNWSSLVLWNCAHPANSVITSTFVNYATPKMLHRFQWLQDSEIGSLDLGWNWLVNWYTEPEHGSPRALHYTEGGPYFRNYFNTGYHEVWKQYYSELVGSEFTIDRVLD